jgi:hypothetical protein
VGSLQWAVGSENTNLVLVLLITESSDLIDIPGLAEVASNAVIDGCTYGLAASRGLGLTVRSGKWPQERLPAMKEPSDSSGSVPINRLTHEPSCCELLPTTSLESLLTEEESQQLQAERLAFEAVGRSLDRQLTFESLYPMLYGHALERLTSGDNRRELEEEMAESRGDESDYAVILRQAYADVLDGRPPRQWNHQRRS